MGADTYPALRHAFTEDDSLNSYHSAGPGYPKNDQMLPSICLLPQLRFAYPALEIYSLSTTVPDSTQPGHRSHELQFFMSLYSKNQCLLVNQGQYGS